MTTVLASEFARKLGDTLDALTETFTAAEQPPLHAWRDAFRATTLGVPDKEKELLDEWHYGMLHMATGDLRAVSLYDSLKARDLATFAAADHSFLRAIHADSIFFDPGMGPEEQAALCAHFDSLCVLSRVHFMCPDGMMRAAENLVSQMPADMALTGDTVTAMVQEIMKDPDSLMSWSTQLARTMASPDTQDLLQQCMTMPLVQDTLHTFTEALSGTPAADLLQGLQGADGRGLADLLRGMPAGNPQDVLQQFTSLTTSAASFAAGNPGLTAALAGVTQLFSGLQQQHQAAAPTVAPAQVTDAPDGPDGPDGGPEEDAGA